MDKVHATQVESIDPSSEKTLEREQNNGDIVLVGVDHNIRKIPIPTTDPNDPLNWSKWRKGGVVGTCCWFAVFSLLSLSGIGTFMNTLYMMYMPAHTAAQVTGLSTYPTMVMAFGSFGLLPLAFVFGRRPVFLFAVVLAFITIITAGTSQDFDGHFISRIFLGLATGATESLLPLIISDVTFLDERSFYFGLYWSVQNCINAGLQIGLSYLTAAGTWRWYYWLFAITLGLLVVIAFFLLPETRFHRPAAAMNGQIVYTDEFGTTHFLSDEDARERFGDIAQPLRSVGEKRTFVQELKPWSPVAENGLKIWIGSYGKILKSLSSPGVLFAMLASSISLGIGVAITLIYSQILEESYGWSASSVGLFNVGIIPASFLAMAHSGWFADKVNVWLAARNSGMHRPEHHLLHLVIPYFTGAVGIIVFGVCANNPEAYSAWGLILAWTLYEFSFIAVLITTTSFAAEAFPENPGAAMVPVVGGKNIIAFGAAYGLIPMLSAYSYLKSFMILLGIFSGIFALGIPVYFLNSKWRQSAPRRT